jgi:PKD domain
MHVGPERRAAVTFAVATLCLFVVMVGFGMGEHSSNPVTPPIDALGVHQLASAISAIGDPQGPGHGAAISCSATSPLAASCSLGSATLRPSASGPAWSNITAAVVPLPSPRFSTMVWDAADGYVLLYGAFALLSNHSEQQVKDTWTYLNGTWTNLTSEVTGGPPPEPIDPTMAYDPWTSQVVLFGGTSIASENLSLTWTYHARVWTNITPTAGTPPAPRWLPVFVADLASQQMILTGGEAPATDHGFDDTWLFTGTAWSNISGAVGSSPPDLALANGVYDPAESGILLVGTNYAGPPYVADTFLFTGGAWHNLTSSEAGNVPALEVPAMGYVASTATVLAVASIEALPGTGGQAFYPVEWSFTAGNWTNITASNTVPASGSAATLTTLPSGALLMFGGEDVGTDLTQWMYAYSAGPSGIQVTASPSTVDAGTATNLSASFSGGLAPFHTTFEFGDGGSSTGTLSTSHAYATAGTETVQFNVTDLTGRTATGSTTVTVNAAPSGLAIHADPTSPTVGEAVNFTSTVTGGTPPYTGAWNFGDASTAVATEVAHPFTSTGTFSVHLVVTDADGKSVNATLELVVTAATSGSNSTSGSETYLILGLVLVAIVAIAVAVLVLRRRRPPTASTTASGPGETAVPSGPLGSPPPNVPNPPSSPPGGPPPGGPG